MSGRPSKLTDAKLATAAASDAITYQQLADDLGVDRHTVTNWMNRGRDDIANEQHDTRYCAFLDIAERVPGRGRERVESSLLNIATAEPGELTPAASIVTATRTALQLIYQRPLPASRHEVTGVEGGAPITFAELSRRALEES